MKCVSISQRLAAAFLGSWLVLWVLFGVLGCLFRGFRRVPWRYSVSRALLSVSIRVECHSTCHIKSNGKGKSLAATAGSIDMLDTSLLRCLCLIVAFVSLFD